MRAGLDHLPAAKRRELERVARVLFDEFEDAVKTKLSDKRKGGRILKLILFGSYARGDWVEDRASGYISDYDLLVIVNSETFTDLQHGGLSPTIIWCASCPSPASSPRPSISSSIR